MAGPAVLRIAHGYGNSRRWLEAALRGPVDMIEADLWYQRGDIWVRHERRLPLLPILYDRRPAGNSQLPLGGLSLGRWHLRLDIKPIALEELVQAVGDRRQLLLDLKGPNGAVQPFINRLVGSLRRFRLEAATQVCGNWALLDELRRTAPEIKAYYSVGGPAQYNALLLRLAEGDPIGAVCIHHALLNEERARFLQGKKIELFAWSVDDATEARRLMTLGVRGLISYDLGVLGSLPIAG